MTLVDKLTEALRPVTKALDDEQMQDSKCIGGIVLKADIERARAALAEAERTRTGGQKIIATLEWVREAERVKVDLSDKNNWTGAPCPECGLPMSACSELAMRRVTIERLKRELAEARQLDNDIEVLREVEVRYIDGLLSEAISNLGYPVGMGMAPHPETTRKAAEKLTDRYISMIAMARKAGKDTSDGRD